MNKPKIGLIQPGGIGDIVIALPIGKHFVDNGFEVFQPIHKNYMNSFVKSAPYINFIPLESTLTIQDAILTPTNLLNALNCHRIINLLSHISPHQELVENQRFSEHFKFDQYKYAVSGIPFKKKWQLEIVRDHERENALFAELNLSDSDEYTVLHLNGSNIELDEKQFSSFVKTSRKVIITDKTNNIFDWLKVIENAKYLIMIDSCYANIVEQLNFKNSKILVLRSPIAFTPVFINHWDYVWINQ